MKLVVWGINYAPELTGIAPYNTALCRHWARAGHDVTMLTAFPYYPSWKKRAGDEAKLFSSEQDGSIKVERCWQYVPKKVTALKRMVHELSFVMTSSLKFLAMRRAELLIIISPPLLLGFAAKILCWLKRVPYIVHVQDLQPDAAVALGMIRNEAMIRLLYWLEKQAYSGALAITSISQRMVEIIQDKVPQAKVWLFPNGVFIPENPLKPLGIFRAKHSIPHDHLLLVYSGNLGMKQGLPVLLEASKELVAHPLTLVICGEGAFRRQIESFYRQHPNPHVRLLPIQPEADYQAMLADADVCLVCQASGSGDYFLPSKLLTMLAAGKPILAVTDSNSVLAKSLYQGGWGWQIDADDPNKIAQAMIELLQRAHEFPQKIEAGRKDIQPLDMESIQQKFERQCVSILHEVRH